MSSKRRAFIVTALGPGLLFAGAAIGVSHLVQSTRAGADYGLALLLIIIVANIFKYPAFSFGPWYAAATGKSLLEGYRRQGLWALVLYTFLTLGTMFTVQAAVTVVTAGLAQALFGIDASLTLVSLVITALCALLLIAGQYRWLDLIMKIVVSILTLLTIFATILVLPRIDWGGISLWPTGEQWSLKTALFVAPLVGWMPSAIDISVWHSLWTLAKRRDTEHVPSVSESMLDFKIGYIGAAVLAVCFLLLGAGIMYGSGETLSPSAGAFAAQVIELYTRTLGSWSWYLIAICAFAVMLSTTLTVIDGFPRALSTLVARYRGPEGESAGDRRLYWVSMAVVSAGALIIIDNIAQLDFTLLIDIATALAVLTAPAMAFLNHRAVVGGDVPKDRQPSPGMARFSLLCIAVLTVFALWWLWVRFIAV